MMLGFFWSSTINTSPEAAAERRVSGLHRVGLHLLDAGAVVTHSTSGMSFLVCRFSGSC
jgi:hypothetical protein